MCVCVHIKHTAFGCIHDALLCSFLGDIIASTDSSSFTLCRAGLSPARFPSRPVSPSPPSYLISLFTIHHSILVTSSLTLWYHLSYIKPGRPGNRRPDPPHPFCWRAYSNLVSIVSVLTRSRSFGIAGLFSCLSRRLTPVRRIRKGSQVGGLRYRKLRTCPRS
jgi:hypothetical protein